MFVIVEGGVFELGGWGGGGRGGGGGGGNLGHARDLECDLDEPIYIFFSMEKEAQTKFRRDSDPIQTQFGPGSEPSQTRFRLISREACAVRWTQTAANRPESTN